MNLTINEYPSSSETAFDSASAVGDDMKSSDGDVTKRAKRAPPPITKNMLSPNIGGHPRPPPIDEDEEPSSLIVKSESLPIRIPHLDVRGSGSSHRINIMAGIRGFSAKNLKSVNTEQIQQEKKTENAQNVTNLLQATLKNYRQFVMDDDDSDDSDEEW